MDERVVKFRVGVMVLASLFIGGILVLLFSDARSTLEGKYTIFIHFDDAPGVTEGTPIRKSGILIGRVDSVSFAPQGGVTVKAKIDGSVKIYSNETPQVSGSLLGGDVVIQFVHQTKNNGRASRAAAAQGYGSNPPPRTSLVAASYVQEPPPVTEIKPDDTIEGTVAPNAFQVISNLEGDLSMAVRSLATAGDEVSKLAGYFNRLLEGNDAQISRIVQKTEDTVDMLRKVLGGAEDIIGDPVTRANLKQTISELPTLLVEGRNTMNSLKGTIESMDRNMRNLEGLTGPLGDQGGTIVNNIESAVGRFDELLANLTGFTGGLGKGEGTIAKLLSDPSLYQHLNATICNIEQLTRDLRPILADARVFSDKIARHPEVLGIRGALPGQNKAGIK